MDESFLSAIIQEILGDTVHLVSFQSIAGGCINNGTRIKTNVGNYFLKWNEHDVGDLFEKESHGLRLLSKAGSLRVPEVLGFGNIGERHYLLQAFIEKEIPSDHFWENFGNSLADLHRSSNPMYGLEVSNHIGRLEQKNDWLPDWIDFFIENRLEVQLGLAISSGYIDGAFAKRFRELYPQLPGILTLESPSLLHGDLWSGNFMVGKNGQACIFDPAVYYGNREIELAFTRLFGGFDQRFYDAYFEAWPVEPGFDKRMDIYNLYPLLVHVNLFGPSYLSGINQVIRRYC